MKSIAVRLLIPLSVAIECGLKGRKFFEKSPSENFVSIQFESYRDFGTSLPIPVSVRVYTRATTFSCDQCRFNASLNSRFDNPTLNEALSQNLSPGAQSEPLRPRKSRLS
jgi:hypothetical protein